MIDGRNGSGNPYSLRPIVYLPSSLKLEREGDTFHVVDGSGEQEPEPELTEPTFTVEPDVLWTNTPPLTVTINYPEIEGVVKEYSYTGEDDWQTYTQPLEVKENKTIYAKATYKGQEKTSSIEITNIDTEPPSVEISIGEKTDNSIELKVEASDEISDLADSAYQYYINNDLESDFSSASSHVYRRLTKGQEYELKVIVQDKAGNITEKSTKETIESKEIDPNAKPSDDDLANPERMKITAESPSGVNEWLPFYNDGTCNHLISYDYVQYNSTYMKTNLTKLAQSGNQYSVYWSSVPTYTYKTNSSWWGKSQYTGNLYDNANCAMSLLTSSNWTYYVINDYGAVAFGSPTLEMYMDAYNKRYPSNFLGYSSSTYGLTYSGNPGAGDRAFSIPERSKCNYWWLASPYDQRSRSGGSYVYNVMHVNSSGGLFSATYDTTNITIGLRPVVRLKPGVGIREKSDGTGYELYNTGT